MKPNSALIFQFGVVTASIFDTILPTTKASITSDPWQCATHTFESFFDVPKPTGALLNAILDHGDAIQKDCKPTLTDAMGMPACTFPPQSDWCAFSKTVPSNLQTAYSSYGSVASSFWAKHSSEAVEYAEHCPNRWFRAMTSLPYGAVWLNDTIAFAGCYAAAYSSGEPRTYLEATTTVDQKSTGTGITAVITATRELNGIAGKRDGIGMWMVAGTGLTAAVVNALP
ncbi:hypothetical protein FSPOR_6788 [Fusarium sporotrichioides]|uniref:DUF7735 domain-containing protein n=1 Tax=Fusarium sporotrichioides TaxID=5514 RepID=A0A395S182_FUSSP|nr:hypothetical protein FSPOR_6788 [Fusarium sporotrichioides]